MFQEKWTLSLILPFFYFEVFPKEDGRMITAAIDSTTKKGVGQFATQGLSIGRNTPFPLPLAFFSAAEMHSTPDVALAC